MKGADLRKSLIATLNDLLEYKKNLVLQLKEAKKIIVHVFENENNMQPISLDRDAVWYNYLLDSLSQAEKDIVIAASALNQIGVSEYTIYNSSNRYNMGFSKNQGDSALDFFITK